MSLSEEELLETEAEILITVLQYYAPEGCEPSPVAIELFRERVPSLTHRACMIAAWEISRVLAKAVREGNLHTSVLMLKETDSNFTNEYLDKHANPLFKALLAMVEATKDEWMKYITDDFWERKQ